MLYISIQRFYATSTQNSINGALCVYYCVSIIFEKLTTDKKFLDINIAIVDNQLHFGIYHKPTNSFSYLKYNSCHPSHTKNNILLSSARCIIRIVTDNRDYRLEKPRENYKLFLYKKLLI